MEVMYGKYVFGKILPANILVPSGYRVAVDTLCILVYNKHFHNLSLRKKVTSSLSLLQCPIVDQQAVLCQTLDCLGGDFPTSTIFTSANVCRIQVVLSMLLPTATMYERSFTVHRLTGVSHQRP
jgi:hypothetical protein